MGWILEGYTNDRGERWAATRLLRVPAHAPASTYRSVAPTTRGCRDQSARCDGGRPRDSTLPLSPPTCSQAPSSSFAPLPRARAWLSSPRTCHLPTANNLGRQAVRLSGPCCEVHAICLPSFSVGIIVLHVYVRRYHGTRCLSICQSTRQSILSCTSTNRAAARPPELAKVGNGAARFGLLFGRGTGSP